ncbi:MAG: WYL domain-containing protein [Lyngbya sp.]|nr:WYL domain-containing protein [Lyngbya sp.]
MPKKPNRHAYSDQQAFERLILLIATILQYPGVGNEELEGNETGGDALVAVQKRLWEVALREGVNFPEGYPSTSNLRKDLQTLRRYGLLQPRMYRWGYYLGLAVLDQQQLRLALQAIASQAQYLGEPQAKQVYQILKKRLRGLDSDLGGELFYPVRQQLNRAIMPTDPEEMVEQGQREETLFHHLDTVEKAILGGTAIELSRRYDVYGHERVGMEQLWPLQLVFHNNAWYLLYEDCQRHHLAIGRIDRFGEYCRILDTPRRSLSIQRQRLADAHKLLTNGWGLYLGDTKEQKDELCGRLQLTLIHVRFFQPVAKIILEGSRRHPKQEFVPQKDEQGNLRFVDYYIKLPPRSHQEFLLWIKGYMESVMVISPQSLATQHLASARKLLELYQEPFSD